MDDTRGIIGSSIVTVEIIASSSLTKLAMLLMTVERNYPRFEGGVEVCRGQWRAQLKPSAFGRQVKDKLVLIVSMEVRYWPLTSI